MKKSLLFFCVLPICVYRVLGFNPTDPDIDGDGYTAQVEAAFRSDPLNPKSTPPIIAISRTEDGFAISFQSKNNVPYKVQGSDNPQFTNPVVLESFEGNGDTIVRTYDSMPSRYFIRITASWPDADADGLPDWFEDYYRGWAPFNKIWMNPVGDEDEDGWSNLLEYYLATSPISKDSNFDGFEDSWVFSLVGPHNPHFGYRDSIDPIGFDAYSEPVFADYDGDGFDLFEERIYGTNPLDAGSNPFGVPFNPLHRFGYGIVFDSGLATADYKFSDGDNSYKKQLAQVTANVGKLGRVTVFFGDDSPSLSERYSVQVGGYFVPNVGYGTTISKTLLVPVAYYVCKLHHIATNPDYIREQNAKRNNGEESLPVPDYDYFWYMDPEDQLSDPDGITGEHFASKTNPEFDAKGKFCTIRVLEDRTIANESKIRLENEDDQTIVYPMVSSAGLNHTPIWTVKSDGNITLYLDAENVDEVHWAEGLGIEVDNSDSHRAYLPRSGAGKYYVYATDSHGTFISSATVIVDWHDTVSFQSPFDPRPDDAQVWPEDTDHHNGLIDRLQNGITIRFTGVYDANISHSIQYLHENYRVQHAVWVEERVRGHDSWRWIVYPPDAGADGPLEGFFDVTMSDQGNTYFYDNPGFSFLSVQNNYSRLVQKLICRSRIHAIVKGQRVPVSDWFYWSTQIGVKKGLDGVYYRDGNAHNSIGPGTNHISGGWFQNNPEQ